MGRGRLVALTVGILVSACGAQAIPESPGTARNSASSVEEIPRGTNDAGVVDDVLLPVADRFVDVALSHPATAGVHAGERFALTEVSAVERARFGVSGAFVRVVIQFDDPLPPERWPAGPVCAIDRDSNDITGIAWLVSFPAETVEAYSPQWDRAIDCVAG